MKRIAFSLLCLYLLCPPLWANTNITNYQNASNLTEGQVLVDNGLIYRKYLGQTQDGYFMVQNFYKNTNIKQSNVLKIRNKNHLSLFQSLERDTLDNLYFEGTLILWGQDGIKLLELTIKEGKAEGDWKKWHVNGMIDIEGSYSQGKKNGIWNYWDEQGNLHTQRYFYHGELQWQKKPFNLSGV